MKTQKTRYGARIDDAERRGSLDRAIASRSILTRAEGAVAATVLLLVCLFGVAPAGASQSFPTPESAITSFIERVKAEDYDGALDACAVNEIATRYDYEALIKSVGALFPTLRYLPPEYGLFRGEQSSRRGVPDPAAAVVDRALRGASGRVRGLPQDADASGLRDRLRPRGR